MIQLFQERDFSNKLNATFQYIVQNFRSLGQALLYIVGPIALVAGIASGIVQSNALKMAGLSSNDGESDPMAMFRMVSQFLSPTFWLAILFGLLANVAVILTTYAHMKVYNRKSTDSISVADVWAEIQPAFGRTLVITVLNSIVITVGFFFLFIPGLYLAVVLSLSLAITVFEGTDFGATWSRCFTLIRNKWWSTFGLIVVTGLIVGIVGLIFSIPSAVIGFLVAGKLLPDVSMVWLILGNIVALVGRTLLNVVIYTAIGFQYTNLVERQEGRGLLSAIDQIGSASTQPRATDEGLF